MVPWWYMYRSSLVSICPTVQVHNTKGRWPVPFYILYLHFSVLIGHVLSFRVFLFSEQGFKQALIEVQALGVKCSDELRNLKPSNWTLEILRKVNCSSRFCKFK